MTVSSNDPRKTYSGNGVTTDFATPYFLVDADIKVYLGGVLQTITTHYTLTGAGVAAGGTVTFLTPPPTGTGNVVIINDPALTQELDLVENDRNPAEAREDALDKLTIIAQRLADRVSRVVQLSETDTATTLTVPALADRLSKFLAFDASGNLIAADGGTMGVPVSAFMATVLDDADAAAAFTTLGISAFVQTLLDDTDAGAFRASLGVGVTSPTITATDVDLTITAAQFAAYDTLVLDLSAWTIPRNVIVPAVGRNFNVAITGSYTATVKTSAGTGITVAAGTSRPLVCDGTNVIDPLTDKDLPGIFSIGASVAANALTITLNPCTIDFRSETLSSGTVNRRRVSSPISMTVSSGSTLGTVNGVASRLAVIAIDSAGTVELAVVNLAGGTNLDETTLISTTAEGGAGAADSASTIYSTTARTNVPFRVVGVVDSTQATAGTWATAPSTIQGAGGNAVSALQSLGYSQTWQDVAGSRALATTYYNTTGRPIFIAITLTDSTGGIVTPSLTVNGLNISSARVLDNASIPSACLEAVVPPGGSYSITGGGGDTIAKWFEMR